LHCVFSSRCESRHPVGSADRGTLWGVNRAPCGMCASRHSVGCVDDGIVWAVWTVLGADHGTTVRAGAGGTVRLGAHCTLVDTLPPIASSPPPPFYPFPLPTRCLAAGPVAPAERLRHRGGGCRGARAPARARARYGWWHGGDSGCAARGSGLPRHRWPPGVCGRTDQVGWWERGEGGGGGIGTSPDRETDRTQAWRPRDGGMRDCSSHCDGAQQRSGAEPGSWGFALQRQALQVPT
jgi:hypothetical protein